MAKPTKYAHVTKGLKKFEGEAPDRLAIINAVRDEIRATPIDGEQDYNISAQLLTKAAALGAHVTFLIGLMKKCPGQSSAAFGRAYGDARLVLDEIKGWTGSAQLVVDAYERMMTDQMEAEGITSMRLASGSSISTYSEPNGSVVDKEAFRQWCITTCRVCGRKRHEHPDLPEWDDPLSPMRNHPVETLEGQLQLWPSVMNAIAKERTLQGEAPPDGVEVTAKTVVRFNKG